MGQIAADFNAIRAVGVGVVAPLGPVGVGDAFGSEKPLGRTFLQTFGEGRASQCNQENGKVVG
jgi:hypothetical protein